MSVDAARLDQAAALARQVLPGSVTDALADRAAQLAPAKLKFDAEFAATANQSKLAPTKLDVTGSMAETRLDIHLAPDPTNDQVTLVAKAEAAHARMLLGQFGFATIPLDVVGASRISLSARGLHGRPLSTSIEAMFGGTHLTAAGSFDLLGGTGQGGSGTVTLESPDAAPLLQALALVPFDATDRLPVDLTAGLAFGDAELAISDLKGRFDASDVNGALQWKRASGNAPVLTGSVNVDKLTLGSLLAVVLGPSQPPTQGATWSSEPFASGLTAPPRTAVAFHAKTIDLELGVTAKNAAIDLEIAPDVLTLTHARAKLAGGELTGNLSVRRDGTQAFLEGSIAVERTTLDVAPVKAELRGKLDFAGSGTSQLALVTSLAGAGQMTFDNTSVAGVDARALPAALAATEDDTLAVDDESVRRALEDSSNGSLELGTRHFTLSLAGGSLTLTPQDRTSVAADLTAAHVDGRFDLRQPQVEVHVDEVLNALPKGWSGPAPSITVRQTAAPGGRPQRTFDVSAFTNAVAARAIARESARIESYEFDVRERALFNARLESDRRREQDRLKMETDARAATEAARKAEVERKARAETSRSEKLREERGAKDRQINETHGGAAEDQTPPFGASPPGVSVDPSAAGRY